MSYTPRQSDKCGKCGCSVPAGTGNVREYTGAARKHAPAGSVRTLHGLRYIICETCDTQHRAGLRVRRTEARQREESLAAKRLGV